MASSSVFAELVRDCKLDGSNFTVWKRKIMFLLTAKNIDYVATTDEPNEPAKEAEDEEKESYREELKEWIKDNKRARIFIFGSMTDSLAGEYESEDVACVIMRRLEEDFVEVSLIKVLSLVNKFLTSKLTESGSEHLNKMCVLSEKLKNAGYPFSEEVQVMVCLNSLPHSWEQFKVSFCHSERSLNMRTLRHHLIMEQDRKSSLGKEKYSQPNELHLGEERRSWNNNKKRKWSDHPKSKINKRNYKCYHCGELRHFCADCPSRKKQYEPNENQRKQQENKHQDNKENSSPDERRVRKHQLKVRDQLTMFDPSSSTLSPRIQQKLYPKATRTKLQLLSPRKKKKKKKLQLLSLQEKDSEHPPQGSGPFIS